MNLRQTCLCIGLGLVLVCAAGCAQVELPPPATVLITVLVPVPTASKTVIPAVADTATALAIAARLGPSLTPAPSETVQTPAATTTAATLAPDASAGAGTAAATETLGPVLTATPILIPAGPSRTPIHDPTSQPLPPGCSAQHTVRPGEWLAEIAQQYGVDLIALQRANKITDPGQLTTGQVLCIPGAVATTAPGSKPDPTATPSALPASGLAILSLTIDPNPVERGAVVRLRWTVQAAKTVSLWSLTYDIRLNQWYRQTAPTYTGSGDAELTVAVPVDARGPVRYELQADDNAGARATRQTDPIQLACYPAFFRAATDPSDCLHPPETSPAEYQAFERGFMIWRQDSGLVYVLTQDPGRHSYWLAWSPTGQTVPTGTPPQRSFAPGANFAEVWSLLGPAQLGGSQALRDILGWGTTPARPFTLTTQVRLDARLDIFDSVFLSWPDGRVAQLFTGGGMPHAGTIGSSWNLFSPTP